jgi:hypothetical protein
MGILFSVEAYDLMVCHTVLLLAQSWDCLNETNHGFVALGIEFTIVASLDAFELGCMIYYGILGNFWLNRMLKICKESDAILEFNLEGLIIYWRPVT